MNLQLIQGEFNAQDAIDILTGMINIKIKYHEDKIKNHNNEEDIKFRETKIKRLQNDLQELRRLIELKEGKITLRSAIEIE